MEIQENNAAPQLMQFITAKWISQPLHVVTKLGIPDILSQGPKSIDDLAKECNAHGPYLYRVMRALASMGIFTETENKVFNLTPMSECLQENKMRSIALMFLSEWHNKAWGKLLHSVKTGDFAFETAFGMPAFDWLEQNPEAAKVFNEANQVKTITTHAAITDVYDFEQFNSITDVGGGYGGLLFKILEKNKNLNGVIADLSYLIKNAAEQISMMNLTDRCIAVACDFFVEVPNGSDCYILSHILHDWDDNKSKDILKNCYDAMRQDAKLLLVEYIVPEGNEFSIAKLLDLEVLVMGGGCERTEKEFVELLNNTGFILENIIDTQEGISILECSKQDH